MRVRARSAGRSAQGHCGLSGARRKLPPGVCVQAAEVSEMRAQALPRWPRIWGLEALSRYRCRNGSQAIPSPSPSISTR